MDPRYTDSKMDPMVVGAAATAEPKKSPDTTDRKKATHLRCERQRREAINVRNVIHLCGVDIMFAW